MGELFGIDVSHYQKKIDWEEVAKAGKTFAIMKAQYESIPHRIDETFEYNYEEAGKHGLARGVYVYIGNGSMADPRNDAECLLDKLKGRPLEYGIWIDLESEALRGRGKAYIKDLVNIYAANFQQSGYFVGIYCNRDWYINVIHEELKANFDFWIARYPKRDDGSYNEFSSLKPSYKMAAAWQYSSKGIVPGIYGHVDLDVDFDGILNLSRPDRKTNLMIAREVIEGKWGTNHTRPTRRQRLIAAGYDYDAVQYLVNNML